MQPIFQKNFCSIFLIGNDNEGDNDNDDNDNRFGSFFWGGGRS